jgi:hypothetical protein
MKARAFLAIAVLVIMSFGLFTFAFMAVVDFLGGWGGPGETFATYPSIASIYRLLGFDAVHVHGQMGVVGFLGFCAATASFIVLRTKRGIRAAVREGVLLFAAPILVVFELGLWYYLPFDMGWHAADFVPWSIGTTYLLSNSVVLFVSSCLTLLGLNWILFHAKGMTRTYMAIFTLESCAALFMLAVALQPALPHLATVTPPPIKVRAP